MTTSPGDQFAGVRSGFELQVLGAYRLTYNGVELPTGTWQRRARTLFTIVATSPQHRRSRDDLIELLWPDSTPEAGASNLRYTVHLLRRALGNVHPPALLTQGGWIELNPALRWEVDLLRFESLAAPGESTTSAAEAAAMYAGEPLAEYRYDDWAAPVRDRVQRLWRDLCLRLGDTGRVAGQFQSALAWYERLLTSDPLDEEALQRLLTVLLASGRHADALRAFSHFAAQLRQELDLTPAPETEALIASLRGRRTRDPFPAQDTVSAPSDQSIDVRPTYPLPRSGRLVGREDELSRLEHWLLEEGGNNTARLALISAEAGMGKSRLLAEVAEFAHAANGLVLAGGSYEEEGRLPWGPIHDALLDYVRSQPEVSLRDQFVDLLPALVYIVPELRVQLRDIPDNPTPDAEAQRLRLFTTLVQALERISSERPLLLILDDLHWSDEVTVQVLHYLVRQPGLERVRILGAYRPDEVAADTPLAGLQARAGADGPIALLQLNPLSEPNTTDLLQDRLSGECSPTLVRRVHERSGGNPYFTIQITGLLKQEDGLKQEEGEWVLSPDTRVGFPSAVRETLGRRLRHLDEQVRTVLTLGAVLGREFDYAPLETISDLSESALFDALDRAQDSGLVRESGQGYVFTHPLLWEAIYGRIPDQRRRRLHDRVGRSLEDLFGEETLDRPAELAWHFIESGNRERALFYALLAGRRAAASIAHVDSERYFRQAVELARALGDQPRVAQGLEGLGSTLRAQAKLTEAIEHLDEAAQIYEGAGDLDSEARVLARWALAWYFTFEYTSQHAERIRHAIHRVEMRDCGTPSLALGTLAAVLPRLLTHHPEEELRMARRATELGRALGDVSIEAAGYLRQGNALLNMTEFDNALDALRQAIKQADEVHDLFTLAAANHFASQAAARLGKGHEALGYSLRAVAASEARGGLEQMAGCAEGARLQAFRVGEWDLVLVLAQRQIDLARSFGHVHPNLHFSLAEVHLHRGEWEMVNHIISRIDSGNRATVSNRFWAQIFRAQTALLQGNAREAHAHLPNMPPLPRLEWISDLEIPRALVLAALRDSRAEQSAQRALDDANDRKHEVSRLEALHALGVTLRAGGKAREASETLHQALPLARSFPYPLLEGQILHEIGCNLAATGKTAEARRHFEEALPLFRRLGARPYVEGTEAVLTSLQR